MGIAINTNNKGNNCLLFGFSDWIRLSLWVCCVVTMGKSGRGGEKREIDSTQRGNDADKVSNYSACLQIKTKSDKILLFVQ